VTVGVRVDDAVAVITIDRPERRNALHHEALEELDVAVSGVADVGARVAILTGAEGHFCAGADLTELEDMAFTERLRSVLDRLADAPLVTIAAISGACMGLGMQLAIACDVRVATDDAYFAVPVAKLGLMVDHWTLQRLVTTFGMGATRHMVLTAETIGSDDAWRLGFVQQRGDLDDARRLAERVRDLAPLSLRGSKLGLNRIERDLHDGDYRAAFVAAWNSEDLVEGRQAFADRRTPAFRGE
jgi:enoyl-CoA hydratase